MSEQTLQILERIRIRIQRTAVRITLADLTYGAVLIVGFFSLVLLVSSLVEASLWLQTTPRLIIFWSALASLLGLAVYGVGIPLLRYFGLLSGLDEKIVARRIGRKYPQVSDRLVNMLDLADGRGSEAPASFVDRAVRMLGQEVEPVHFERVESFDESRKAGRYAAVPVAGVFLFLLIAPGPFMDASFRLMSPSIAFERPAPFALVVEPGTVELVRGASLEVTARAAGAEVPSSVALHYRYAGEERNEELILQNQGAGEFAHTFVNVRQPMHYRIEAEKVASPWYSVNVVERPVVRGMQVSLNYPAYTGLPSRRLSPNVGDVSALPGTRVTVEVAYGGQDVTDARIVFDGESELELELQEGRALGTFTLRYDGQYQVLLRNALDITNENPISYSLTTLVDEYPSIRLIEPEPVENLTESLQANLRLRISDDYGFSRIRLHYRIAESRFGDAMEEARPVDIPLPSTSNLDQQLLYNWNLATSTGISLAPGDVIEYHVTVWDNDAVAGFKSATSATHVLRFPSLTERYEELAREQDSMESELETLMRESQSVRNEFESLRDELRRKQESDWEDQRQIERLGEQQQRLEERVDQLSEQMESVTSQMRENNLVSQETLQRYEELKRVIEEINSPELMEALKQLQDAMNELNMRQMQEAIQNFEFNEEQYRQRLERTLDLFKQMRMQQKLDESARRADELAQRQERMQQQTEALEEEASRDGTDEAQNEQRAEDLAAEQERAASDMQELIDELSRLREQMEEMRRAPTEEMDALQRDLEEEGLPQQMQENSEQLRNQEFDGAQESQSDMQQQLENLSERLDSMMQQMAGQQMSINMAALRKAFFDVLTLSHEQEALRSEVRESSGDGPLLREKAQQQQELSNGLSTVTDSLQSISRDIPQMSRAVQQQAGQALMEMDRATESLSERRASQAGGHQTASMAHLNELALMLSNLMDQLRNMDQNGAGGNMSLEQMIQQLQQMAGDQQQLNQQIQELLNDIQGDRLTQDQQERLEQMAAQQEALRRQLREMGRQQEAGQLLGDLDRIAQQMEETIRELQERQVDRRLIERQQEILTRLLEAQRSMQRRGEEEERRATTGEDVVRESPAAIPEQEVEERLRRDLLRALDSGYAPDYEELIRRYFELLQQNGTSE